MSSVDGLHVGPAGGHNASVGHPATRLFVTARSVMVILAVAVSGVADLQASATAMACCAKTNYACARTSGPDDCCQHMGHTAAATPASAPASFRLVHPIVGVVAPVVIDSASSTLCSHDAIPAFKRPHDPPHLHAHILLI
jgi:hypothetical protein